MWDSSLGGEEEREEGGGDEVEGEVPVFAPLFLC